MSLYSINTTCLLQAYDTLRVRQELRERERILAPIEVSTPR